MAPTTTFHMKQGTESIAKVGTVNHINITSSGTGALGSRGPIRLDATRQLFGVVQSFSELVGATLSLPVVFPSGTYSYLPGATRRFLGVAWSSSEFLEATLSLPVAPPTGTYSYLLGAALSCSELLGAILSLQVASPTGTYRYSYLLTATRSCSEQKCLSNQSHSKCTNGVVYKVKTSKLGNIVKPGQPLEKLFLTREGNPHFYQECFFHRSFLD